MSRASWLLATVVLLQLMSGWTLAQVVPPRPLIGLVSRSDAGTTHDLELLVRSDDGAVELLARLIEDEPAVLDPFDDISIADLDGDGIDAEFVLLVHPLGGELDEIRSYALLGDHVVQTGTLLQTIPESHRVVGVAAGLLDGDEVPDLLTLEILPEQSGPKLRRYELIDGVLGPPSGFLLPDPPDRELLAVTIGGCSGPDARRVVLVERQTIGALATMEVKSYELLDGELSLRDTRLTIGMDLGLPDAPTQTFRDAAVGRAHAPDNGLLLVDGLVAETTTALEQWRPDEGTEGVELEEFLLLTVPAARELLAADLFMADALSCPAAVTKGGILVDVATLSWSPVVGATGYDVVRGDLSLLRSTGGDFSVATEECLADDLGATGFPFATDPSPGDGFWFLLRGETSLYAGTYGSPQRDAGIAASGVGCP